MSIQPSELERKTARIVFVALLLDLTSFTMILPLLPRLVEHYVQAESKAGSTLLSSILQHITNARKLFASSAVQSAHASKSDIVLLGGLLGSLFSFAQFVVSPRMGAWSDRQGRKKILLATMAGNVGSALIWLFSTSFDTFLLSRIVGGLSESNVQVSIAILSDVSTPATRHRSLALVGIAFSLCFTAGPLLGAYLASKPFHGTLAGLNVNICQFQLPFEDCSHSSSQTLTQRSSHALFLSLKHSISGLRSPKPGI
jgi:MFS family permease